MRSFRYMMLNCFVVWVALAAIVGGTTFFIDPAVGQDASIHQAVGHLDQAYNLLYLAGGAVTLSGMLAINVRAEIAGLSLLGAALVINSIAIIVIHGGAGVSGGSTVGALGIACIFRLEELWRAVQKAVE